MNSPVNIAGHIRFAGWSSEELRRFAAALNHMADLIDASATAAVQADLFLTASPAALAAADKAIPPIN